MKNATFKVLKQGVIETGYCALAGLTVLRETMALARALQGNRPIVIGPWLSEVGYEVLYWIPFLQRAFATYGVSCERVLIVSRGGCEAWYGNLGSKVRYVDVFSYLSPSEYRDFNQSRIRETGLQKQIYFTQAEASLLRRIQAAEGILDGNVLHPSLMYRMLRPFWNGQTSIAIIRRKLAFQPFPPPAQVLPAGVLPKHYVAAKFYFRDSFPDTAENRELVQLLLRKLARRTPVVLLDAGLRIDDHTDSDVPAGNGIFRLDEYLTAANNLRLQTSVLAGARFFAGTYGGFSYLGPFLGVPSYAVYSTIDFQPVHNHVMLVAQQDLAATTSAGCCWMNTATCQQMVRLLGEE